MSVSPQDCASTVSVGPSAKTLQTLPNRIKALTQQALPWNGVKLSKSLHVSPQALYALLVPEHREYQQQILNFLGEHPLFKDKHMLDLTLEQQRQLTLEQLKVISKSPLYRFRDLVDNKLRWAMFMETLYFHGVNIGTKAGVHYGLFGGTVINIGTPQQYEPLIEAIQNLDIRGCFALTELGHGSNARDIETTATWNPEKRVFLINTPTETAQKMWIGNAGQHGNTAAVFAQLYMNGVNHGVHVFLVTIRTKDGQPAPGVRVKDCGTKMGLNGVDNGRLWFDNVEVPRESLLSRFGLVDASGVYKSQISSPTKRFTAMISSLVGGRMIVSQGALHICKVALTIAIRYALSRRQFGPEGKKEVLLLDYTSHQRRLFPLLAKVYALQFALNHVKKLWESKDNPDPKELHIMAAGLKPACTWHRVRTLQECREACGGMGFHAANRIGVLKTDSDIDVTWEGDNSVLLQQVSTSLMKELRQQTGKASGYSGILAYFGRQLELEIRDKNIFKKMYSSEEHLTDYDFFRNAMEYREARLLRGLVNKVRRNAAKGPFESWNASLDIARELAIASIDRLVLEQFIKGIANAPAEAQPMLHALCSLFALTTIEQHMGWFMTFRYFLPVKARAIWHETNKICQLLRPHAQTLVDAFNIPESLLDAPIASDWIKAFSYPNIPADIIHSAL